MKQRFLSLLLLFMTGVSGWAYDFIVDGIYYYKRTDGVQVVRWFGNDYAGDLIIPDSVTYNGKTYKVVGIGDYAFQQCSGLNSVTVPSSVEWIAHDAFFCAGITSVTLNEGLTAIGQSAFYGCSKLKSIVIPNSVTSIAPSNNGYGGVFERCSSLESVQLPSTITAISQSMFSGCTKLSSLSVPTSVTNIEQHAFYGCTTLTSITLPEDLQTIGVSAFEGCTKLTLDLPASLTALGESALKDVPRINVPNYDAWMNFVVEESVFGNSTFGYGNYWGNSHVYYHDEIITDYRLPDDILEIGNYRFYGCTDMTSITIPSTVRIIGQYAFYNCTGISSVTMPESLKKIGNNAFGNCTSLANITFGSTTPIETLDNNAFYGCTALDKVDIGNLTNWCGINFVGDVNTSPANGYLGVSSNPLAYAKKIYLNGQQLDGLRIPSGVTKIKRCAFCNCARFSSISIPNSVTTIDEYAFCGCTDLENVTFGKRPSLKTIGNAAFRGCTSLTNITLPETVINLSGAFYDCTNLVSANIPANVTEIGPNTFNGCKKLGSITIPSGTTIIGNWAFYNCSSLPRIDIPESVEYIGTEAFKGCAGLTGVYITDIAAWCNVKFGNYQYQGSNWAPDMKQSNPLIIAHNLYLNNELVTNLVIPSTVKDVQGCVFWGAECLESVIMEEGVETVGDYSFCSCYNLREIHIPSSIQVISGTNYVGGVPVRSFSYLINNKTDRVALYIPNLETWLSRNLGVGFASTSSNYSCIDLYVDGQLVRDIIVPESFTKLGSYALSDLKLNSVTLPSGLESCKESFYHSSIPTIYSRSKFAPAVNGTSLGSVSDLTAIYVPKGRSSNYKSNWSTHASIIKEAPENINPTGNISVTALAEEIDAHNHVYDDVVPYLNLTEATLDETVTAESLQDIADKGTIIFLPDGTQGIEGTNIVANGRTPKLILRDSTDFVAPYDFVAEELEYQRNFTASNTEATTLCMPYNMSELPEGMKAYALKGQDEDGNAVFQETEALEANIPYVVTSTKNINSMQGENVLVKATPAVMPDAGCDEFEFHGALTKVSHDDAAYEEAYVLSTGRQWQSVYDASEDVYVPAGHAYLVPMDIAPISFGTVLQTTSPNVYAIGDVNGDNVIDALDASLILQYVAHKFGDENTDFIKAAADTNNDNMIDALDASLVLQHAAKKIDLNEINTTE